MRKPWLNGLPRVCTCTVKTDYQQPTCIPNRRLSNDCPRQPTHPKHHTTNRGSAHDHRNAKPIPEVQNVIRIPNRAPETPATFSFSSKLETSLFTCRQYNTNKTDRDVDLNPSERPSNRLSGNRRPILDHKQNTNNYRFFFLQSLGNTSQTTVAPNENRNNDTRTRTQTKTKQNKRTHANAHKPKQTHERTQHTQIVVSNLEKRLRQALGSPRVARGGRNERYLRKGS